MKLHEICTYRNEKEETANASLETYITTDNMLPNKEGITLAEKLPNAKKVSVYKKGDTLVSNIRPYFKKIWLADKDGTCSNDILIFKPTDSENSKLLYYILSNDLFFDFMMKTSKGTKMPRGDKKSIINDFEFVFPELYKRNQIVSLLSIIDKQIEVLNKINQIFDSYLNLIFEELILKTFENQSENDKWEIGSLEDICFFQNGYAFKSSELINEKINNSFEVFKQGLIKVGGGINVDGTKSWISKDKVTNLSKYILKKGDVLMAMTDMKNNIQILGNTAIIPFNDKYIQNQRVGLLRPRIDSLFSSGYLSLLTNHPSFLNELRKKAHSGVQVNLSTKDIKSMPVIIPDQNTLKNFNSIINPFFEYKYMIYDEINILKNLKSYILPKLISGEIDVSELNIET